jgi:hypothetical protein
VSNSSSPVFTCATLKFMDLFKSVLSPLIGSTGTLPDTLVSYLMYMHRSADATMSCRNLSLLGALSRQLGGCLRLRGTVLWTVRSSFLYQNACSSYIITAFFLTAHFSQDDYPYDWYGAKRSHILLIYH